MIQNLAFLSFFLSSFFLFLARENKDLKIDLRIERRRKKKKSETREERKEDTFLDQELHKRSGKKRNRCLLSFSYFSLCRERKKKIRKKERKQRGERRITKTIGKRTDTKKRSKERGWIETKNGSILSQKNRKNREGKREEREKRERKRNNLKKCFHCQQRGSKVDLKMRESFYSSLSLLSSFFSLSP